MEVEITNEKDNALFKRKEISGVIKSKSAPKREEVLKFLSEKYSKPEELIKIKGINGSFGIREFKLDANIYDSKEEKDMLEVKKKKEEELEKKKAESEKATEENKEKPSEDKSEKKEESEEKKKEGKSDQPKQEKDEEKAKEMKPSQKEEKAKPDKEPSQKPEEVKKEAEGKPVEKNN